MSERPAALLPPPSQYLTSYCFSDYYLVVIKRGSHENSRHSEYRKLKWEAPPSVVLREDFWQVTFFNMMENGSSQGDCLHTAQLLIGWGHKWESILKKIQADEQNTVFMPKDGFLSLIILEHWREPCPLNIIALEEEYFAKQRHVPLKKKKAIWQYCYDYHYVFQIWYSYSNTIVILNSLSTIIKVCYHASPKLQYYWLGNCR